MTLLIVFNQTNGHLCTHLLYKSTTSSPKIRCTTYVGYFFQTSINIGHESSHQFFFYFFLFFVVHRSADLKDKLSFFTRRSMYINSSSKPPPPPPHSSYTIFNQLFLLENAFVFNNRKQLINLEYVSFYCYQCQIAVNASNRVLNQKVITGMCLITLSALLVR